MFALVVSVQTLLAADNTKIAAANNTFSFKLLKQLVAEKSIRQPFPFAIQRGNGVADGGKWRGGPNQNRDAAGFGNIHLSSAELNAACKAAADLLNSNDTNVILTTANALWYRQGAAVKPGFLEANRNYFSSTIKALDFGNVRAAEAEINQWASDQTHGRITGIADGMIDLSTRI